MIFGKDRRQKNGQIARNSVLRIDDAIDQIEAE